MTSKLIVNSIRHTGASADAITMDASGNVTFPANATCSGTATGFGVEGITMADQWRVHTSFDSYDTDVTTNWERNDTDFTLIGSGMTESSGIFTFPATGIYKIEWGISSFRMPSGATLKNVGGYIYTTTDNSNYNIRAQVDNSISTDNYASSAVYMNIIFDVTNTSTHKVKFGVFAEDTMRWEGQSGYNMTFATFTRLGDT